MKGIRKFKIKKDFEVSNELILKLIEQHQTEVLRLNNLTNYYNNYNNIVRREQNNPNRPNNKLAHGYAQYITDISVGYLFGKPVAYAAKKTNIDPILEVLRYNDEADTNTTLAKYASMYGYAYEIMYTDSLSNLRFKAIDPREMIVCYDNTLDENIVLAIRYYTEIEDEEEVVYGTVYTRPTYDKKGEVVVNGTASEFMIKSEDVTIEKASDYYFDDIPVNVYVNNDELYGDFEKVTSLIDAYDLTRSDTANDLEYFTNCMLVVSGEVIDEEDKENIDEHRVINFTSSEGKAEYLIKNINDTAIENHSTRLDKDISRFSGTPRMDDESFVGNSSGVSMAYKMTGLENRASVKESKFRKGLIRRIELICGFLKVKAIASDVDFMDIEPIFTRNRPNNLVEIADIMQKLRGLLSDETLISLFPEVNDVQAELDRIDREKKESQSDLFIDDYNRSTLESNIDGENATSNDNK